MDRSGIFKESEGLAETTVLAPTVLAQSIHEHLPELRFTARYMDSDRREHVEDVTVALTATGIEQLVVAIGQILTAQGDVRRAQERESLRRAIADKHPAT